MEKIDRWAYRLYTEGVLHEGLDDLPEAARNYQKAFYAYPDSYEIGYSLANVLYRMRETVQALDVLRTLHPQDLAVLRLTAACYRMAGSMEEAKATYLEILDIEDTDDAAYSFLLSYYQRRNDLDSTVWVYRKVAERQPRNYMLQNEIGKLLALKADYTGAKQAYTKSLEIDSTPANLIAGISLAEIYEISQQPDSALSIFKLALEVSPSNVRIHREIARLYFQQELLTEAIPHIRAISELTPNDLDASRRLGILYFSLDSLEQADSIFTKLVAAGDDEAVNHFYLGQIAIQETDYDRAENEFTKLTESADTVYDSWAGLAFVYRSMGDTAREIATYRTGLEKMKDDQSRMAMLFALGATFEQSGRIDSAIATLERILKIDPDHHQALNYLGYTLADNGLRLEYARGLISQAVEMQPDNPAYLDSYGWVHYQLGNYEDAVEHLEAAVKLDNDPVILDHLGDAYQSLGKMKDARRWWQEALDLQPDNDTIREKLSR